MQHENIIFFCDPVDFDFKAFRLEAACSGIVANLAVIPFDSLELTIDELTNLFSEEKLLRPLEISFTEGPEVFFDLLPEIQNMRAIKESGVRAKRKKEWPSLKSVAKSPPGNSGR